MGGRVPKMYVKYLAVQKKVNELEAEQKAMAAKYFAETELNKKHKKRLKESDSINHILK
jgi:hypothetical protein